ncbi:hypothetical protein PR003_g29677 [Phytophthora rubi]|uniref:Uncharacterized protein n=2 Tax=Phytophthora TaxID=4783 RepID=A0A6A3HXB1_9STRA|nr:hypothetical protein PF003_g22330 [Phytophthora fragariae]KAE8973682.1 hypothetical protein PR001_g26238 [Phytophthora rubi]KAE9196083.1 hypothetical protein PF004_g20249 [Phytophthora fragariae]KAE9274213.1 hypothetical protein PR003_g29677 [Phytophthora rubi]
MRPVVGVAARSLSFLLTACVRDRSVQDRASRAAAACRMRWIGAVQSAVAPGQVTCAHYAICTE